MNVRFRLPTPGERVVETEAPLFRLLALGASVVVLATYLAVFYEVTIVEEGTVRLAAIVFGTLVAATAASIVIDERVAAVLAAAFALLGSLWYLSTLSDIVGTTTVLLNAVVVDTLALATGISIFQITEAGLWVAAVAPVPTFLAWYFTLRRRYVLSVVAGGSMLLFLILTTDLTLVPAVVGVLACLCTIGFGELELRGGTSTQLDTLVVLLAVIAVSGVFVTLVPAGGASLPGSGLGIGGGGGGEGDLETNLMATEGQLSVSGSPELTPEVRFTVESDRPQRWRVETYDRYTGSGWASTADSEPYDGELEGPPDPADTTEQTYTIETRSTAMPAAAHPVSVSEGVADITLVREDGSLSTRSTFTEGDSYTVQSEKPFATPEVLNQTGTDYPDDLQEQYTELPGSTPDRVGEFTDDLTAPASTPYEQAAVIERYLETEKRYDLDTERPDGDIADSFLFEMDTGYCTFYATTMVTMLRTQDIPARLAVGYNTGQQVENDTYVVRGSDAHVWVEVYFEDIGWVEFDPTPAADWQAARSGAVSEARLDDETDINVDIEASENESYRRPGGVGQNGNDDPVQGGVLDTERQGGPDTPSLSGDDLSANDDIDDAFREGIDRTEAEVNDTEPETGPVDEALAVLPSGERLTLAVALLVGVVAGVRRTGAGTKARRTVQLYWQRPGNDPNVDARRAGRRVERHLERKYRVRKPNETRQEYVEALPVALDDRVYRVLDTAERAEYGDGVDPSEAREAIELADTIVTESAPIIGRFRS